MLHEQRKKTINAKTDFFIFLAPFSQRLSASSNLFNRSSRIHTFFGNKKGMVSLGLCIGGSGKPFYLKHDDSLSKKLSIIVGIHPTTHTRSV